MQHNLLLTIRPVTFMYFSIQRSKAFKKIKINKNSKYYWVEIELSLQDHVYNQMRSNWTLINKSCSYYGTC